MLKEIQCFQLHSSKHKYSLPPKLQCKIHNKQNLFNWYTSTAPHETGVMRTCEKNTLT